MTLDEWVNMIIFECTKDDLQFDDSTVCKLLTTLPPPNLGMSWLDFEKTRFWGKGIDKDSQSSWTSFKKCHGTNVKECKLL